MTTWAVTFKTGTSTWTTTSVEAVNHEDAITEAARLLRVPVSQFSRIV